MWSESAEMANVVIGPGDSNFERRIARHAELVARNRRQPTRAAGQFVVTTASHAFHDFRCPGIECQNGWQNHADGLLAAIGKGDAVAHALTVEVDIGLGCDADVVNAECGHGAF